MSSIQACCVCLVWRSNPMWCRLNRTGSQNLGTRNITWCDERIRQDLLCHHLCRCSRKRHNVRIVAPSESRTIFMCTIVQHDTQRKQWKSSCQTSTNLINTCLVLRLTECLLEDAKTKEVLDNTKACVSQQGSHKETKTVIHRGEEGCQHAEPMTHDEHEPKKTHTWLQMKTTDKSDLCWPPLDTSSEKKKTS